MDDFVTRGAVEEPAPPAANLPLVTPGRMRKRPPTKSRKILGARLFQKKKRLQRNAGEPAHGNINLASEI
jgi:hypothetical protein